MSDAAAVVFVCTPITCDVSKYGYVHYFPTKAGNGAFLGIMALFIAAQSFLAWKYKKTGGVAVAVIMGLFLEIFGYVGRIQLGTNPFNRDMFLMYLICLTIGPVFFAAAIYLTLGRIVVVYGEDISRIKPRTYTSIFLACDILSLVVQAVGGGIAASYTIAQQNMIDLGTHILVAGLSIQVAALFGFSVAAGEFLWRVKKNPGMRNPNFTELTASKKFKIFLYALFGATLLLFIRTVYRSVELSGGFQGHLANDEILFMILDGVMVILALTLMTVFHPGWGFQGRWPDAYFKMITSDSTDKSTRPITETIVGENGETIVIEKARPRRYYEQNV